MSMEKSVEDMLWRSFTSWHRLYIYAEKNRKLIESASYSLTYSFSKYLLNSYLVLVPF